MVDVTDEASVNAMVAATVARFGRLDILVNNAGINIRNRPEEYDLADWHKVIATNLTSAMLASKAAYPHLKAGGHGRVINNGSMLSIFGLPFHAAYGASQGRRGAADEVLAVAWAADGITVNCLLPGWIDTDLTRKARGDMAGLNDNVLARTPKGRWGYSGGFRGYRRLPRLGRQRLHHRRRHSGGWRVLGQRLSRALRRRRCWSSPPCRSASR